MESTELLKDGAEGISRAAALIRTGRLVAFPTETVYGLGADATRDEAVARVFEAKKRPSFNPLIIHVPRIAEAEAFAEFNAEARALAEAFWPGPLTLVLPRRTRSRISELATAGAGTVALRVPGGDTAHRLLLAAGRPIAAPSANPSGRISPTTAAHVLEGLGGRIAAILDGGPTTVGLESTVVAPGPEPQLLRHGGLTQTEIENVIGRPLIQPAATEAAASPGQLLVHYAPRAPLRMNVTAPAEGELFLGFGPLEADRNLSRSGDLVEAAANLFSMLHALDTLGQPIAVAPVPDEGLGRAINDRLRRAASA